MWFGRPLAHPAKAPGGCESQGDSGSAGMPTRPPNRGTSIPVRWPEEEDATNAVLRVSCAPEPGGWRRRESRARAPRRREEARRSVRPPLVCSDALASTGAAAHRRTSTQPHRRTGWRRSSARGGRTARAARARARACRSAGTRGWSGRCTREERERDSGKRVESHRLRRAPSWGTRACRGEHRPRPTRGLCSLVDIERIEQSEEE